MNNNKKEKNGRRTISYANVLHWSQVYYRFFFGLFVCFVHERASRVAGEHRTDLTLNRNRMEKRTVKKKRLQHTRTHSTYEQRKQQHQHQQQQQRIGPKRKNKINGNE